MRSKEGWERKRDKNRKRRTREGEKDGRLCMQQRGDENGQNELNSVSSIATCGGDDGDDEEDSDDDNNDYYDESYDDQDDDDIIAMMETVMMMIVIMMMKMS